MSDPGNKKTGKSTAASVKSCDPMSDSIASSDTKSAPDLLANYPCSTAEVFDELRSENGDLRSNYSALIETLGQWGPAELRRRWDTGKRLVQEQDITYKIYGDPRAVDHPWRLDPIPFLISPDEWRRLESGLIQRATLLDQILADCYGPQELIRSRWLSPALVFAQPDFLRPCHGAALRSQHFLHFYAVDLARSPDGRWWAISDRTAIPTGAGYALANRLVTSRILPEPFSRVHRLAGFFREIQNSLAELAPRKTDKPRIVLLTAGPYNETYFEQIYLARYLGYTLVEGQDLTVRDNRVFLKTLSGLEPVDVILRRVDDHFCDPLELRNDSILGVPGLLEAVRARHVAIANALGSGLVQSPAFMAFLPELCRHLLGEELQLPSVATWWCGQTSARQYVLDHLPDLSVRPAFGDSAPLSASDQPRTRALHEALRRRIEFDPDLFVAQEQVELSTAPSWEGHGLVPRPIGFRAFLVAGRNGYRVMPGGFTRVSPDGAGHVVSMQQGSSTKDTWVLSETPVAEITLLHSVGQILELRRTGNNLPSRLADNFFWLGRYSERADATARFLRSALLRFNPERTGSALPLLAPLLQTLESQGQLMRILSRPELRQNPEAFEAELLAAIFDSQRPGSLRRVAEQLQRIALGVRERTSHDMWRVLNRLNERLSAPKLSPVVLAGEAMDVLNETLLGLAAFHGLARENMTRAQAWRFLDMGLRLERALYLGTLIEATLRSPDAENPSVLEAILEVADSSITYRSRYNLLPQAPAVFDLILLDDRNPRSVLFQLLQLAKHFEHLPPEREKDPASGQGITSECLETLSRIDARELGEGREHWEQSRMLQAIRIVLHELPRLSNAVAAAYFSHSTLSRTGRDSSA
jgi:uncharacterized circularly permuted ATP-grasp superfamily protein/uncharacterized alpha-E superfamily protein